MLTVSIMAHPTRERLFPYLRKMLGDVPMAVDHDSAGVWPNCRRAWELGAAIDTDAPYHCVIQDDAVICENFYERANAVLQRVQAQEERSGPLVVNFYFARRPALMTIGRQSMRRGFWLFENVCWGVAICLRREWIPEMIAHAEKLSFPQDDERIASWCRATRRKVYFPVPSLVDHRPPTEVQSLVGDPGNNRRAYAFIDKVPQARGVRR